MPFFQDPNILKLLTNVLFIWAKTNPDISYKQGINELLASIVYVYFQEAVQQDFQPSNEYPLPHLALNKNTSS
jgi:TBC1 domain family protein 5